MAEINDHVCRSGALVDLDNLAFKLVARTELHYFSLLSKSLFPASIRVRHSRRRDVSDCKKPLIKAAAVLSRRLPYGAGRRSPLFADLNASRAQTFRRVTPRLRPPTSAWCSKVACCGAPNPVLPLRN